MASVDPASEPPGCEQPEAPGEWPGLAGLDRARAHRLSLAIAVSLTLLAWLVSVWALHQPFPELFAGGLPVGSQLLAGGLLGAAASAAITAALFRLPVLEPVRALVCGLVAAIRPTRAPTKWAADAAALSLAAGFSEELFFRAALQPWIGVGWSSLVFAVAHVGPLLRTREGATYAAYVFAVGLFLASLYAGAGTWAAMAAHAALDLVMFLLVAARSDKDRREE